MLLTAESLLPSAEKSISPQKGNRRHSSIWLLKGLPSVLSQLCAPSLNLRHKGIEIAHIEANHAKVGNIERDSLGSATYQNSWQTGW